jgi:hypothetical protein
MANPELLDVDELLSRIAAEHDAAQTSVAEQSLSSDRARNISYYLGDVSRDLPKPGIDRSGYVSQDVSDVVDGLLPGLLEVILGEPPVSFAPVGAADVMPAQQETEACYRVLFVLNDGFQFVHDTLKDGLLEKVGYGKVRRVTTTKTRTERYQDQTDEEFAFLVASGGRISEHAQIAGADGTSRHNVTLEFEEPETSVVVTAVAPEDITVSSGCLGNITEATYIAHAVEMTASQLREMGVSDEDIETLQSVSSDRGDKPERSARSTPGGWRRSGDVRRNEANRRLEIIEHYIETDTNSDGLTEKLIVHTDARMSRVLLVQEAEAHDFVSWSPIRVTHRHLGRAVADKTIPYMQAKTAVTRTLFDNFFVSTHPRPVIGDDVANEHTLDDYLLIRPGAPIRTAKGLPIPVYQSQPIAAHVAPVLEMLDQRQEYSTGFSRAGVSVDRNSFNSTATGANILSQTQQAMQKFYARMYVEQLFSAVIRAIHRHLRMGGIRAIPIQVGQKWIDTSPREWKERKFVEPNVNLGTTTKEQQFAFATQAVGLTEKIIALQGGLKGPFVYPANAYHVLRSFFQAGGRKDVGSFIEDPTTPPTPERLMQLGVDPAQMNAPKPPPPEVQIAQVQAQTFQQVEQQKAQIKAETDIAVARIKAETDAIVEKYKADLAAQSKAMDAMRATMQPRAYDGGLR